MKRNMKDSAEFDKNRTADYEIEHKETPQSKVPSGTLLKRKWIIPVLIHFSPTSVSLGISSRG